ncbi:hypothetical protein MHM84_13985 [Halomonas sp. McH1-25]|uniref:hypothetical protein n=1 Tax=unclassified Halomonas TaxID=2609666 RepID=UPI001EF4AE87|nr:MULTISPECIES: hypothetical protein [unclassified Halomonas]MCG7600896.1 hypothetical protein [Halomonas sp. McH1-25]MCP1341484.1 hypothetical protein [Halomonas sp. FL8]MCP1360075.1 hypothetical protein [Halomonas sp. BBD45]MCP1364235.1 hypothetical protein [Halomonas sp. BBD48]
MPIYHVYKAVCVSPASAQEKEEFWVVDSRSPSSHADRLVVDRFDNQRDAEAQAERLNKEHAV